jgi:hypothetical protein
MTRTGTRLASALALCTIAFTALVPLLHPTYLTWGSTPQEPRVELHGDEFAPVPDYQVQHAVTISAPAAEVWPWLAQIGQDRAGFYSYSSLENLVALHIHNATQVHPEWQDIRAEQVVRALRPGWLGRRMDDKPGWRVARVDPGRAIVLDAWGTFVLVPVDARTTRLVIRSRGRSDPGAAGAVLAPIGAMLFEPIHFLMQRRMMLGIKERAERGVLRIPGTTA